jgi:hypothetical protein
MSNFGHEKIRISESLENRIFDHPLKKRELEALRLRCESYQAGASKEWHGDLFRAYSRYFGFLSSLKVKAVLKELYHYGYLELLRSQPISLIDFGAGTLGATLGALDFFRENKWKVSKAIAIDQDLKPIQWAAKEFEDFLKVDLGIRQTLPDSPELKNSVFISVDVLNEMGLLDEKFGINAEAPYVQMLKSLLHRMDENSVLILIEPASRHLNQNFLRLRDLLSKEAHILLPCTHEFNCPAVVQEEWCHEDRDYLAPSMFWNLVHELGFQRGTLSFSMLCLSKQKNRFKPTDARMVSRQLKSKGRCDKWLCSQGKRWKAGVLLRHRSEQNEAFFEATRGDIVDCVSTGLKSPD